METQKNPKIFVVDDDPFYRNVYEQHLRNLGYTDITTCNDGQECLNRITDNPDIVFLDHQMAPLNGVEVLRKIKRFNPDIFLLVISAQENMQVAVNALKYGAFDYVIKGENDLEMITAVLQKIKLMMDTLATPKRSGWRRMFSRS